MSENESTSTVLTPEQQVLNNLWEDHVRSEFATRDTARDSLIEISCRVAVV